MLDYYQLVKKTSEVKLKKSQKLGSEVDKNSDSSQKTKKPKNKKMFKMISAFSIILLIIAILVLVTWILHWTGVKTDVNVIIGYNPSTGIPITQSEPQTIKAMGIVDIFYSLFQGFMNKSGIIIFILMLGAYITIIINSKALDGFAQQITKALKGKEVWAIVPLMFFFSVCGTVEGMAEESLGFYMICIPLMLAAGFDVFTGLLIVLVGAGVGTLASTVNPFVVTVAVDALNSGAGNVDSSIQFISVGDGLVWRLICWLIMTAAAIIGVMTYAIKTKKHPAKSITFSTLAGDKKFFLSESQTIVVMDWRKKLTLAVFALSFILMIVYLIGWDSILGGSKFADAGKTINNRAPYLTALIPGFGIGDLTVVACFFLISAIVLGLVNGLGEDGFLKQFMAGAADILSVCLIIATAAGVGVILEQSHLQELFVKGLTDSVGGISPVGRIVVLYLLFLPLSFVIPSTSGFATAVFPLLASTVSADPNNPNLVAGDIAGSGSILSFSFASGLLNLFTPTSGVVMGAIGIARVDYGKFLKGIWPFLAGLLVLSVILLAIGGVIGGKIA